MLSIVIPTLDEARVLGKTLSHLQRLPGDFEVLVVDGESRDPTRKIAEQMGVRLLKSPRGITKQLMLGAMEAKGDMLLFLHADCLLHQECVLALNDLEEQDGPVAGAFRHEYDAFSPILALQCAINNGNARLFRQFGGEQGMFMNREALGKIGGLPDAFVFEDKKLSTAIKKAGVPTYFLQGPVISSGRRFKRGFGIGAFMKVNMAHALYDFGVSDYRLKKYFSHVR